jgi:phosphatidate cytidylyltransferase
MSLRKRTPTAIVFLAIVFAVIQFTPNIVMFLFLQGIVVASLIEFYNLAQRRKHFPERLLGVVMALILCAPFYFKAIPFELALFGCFLLAGLWYVITFNTIEKLVTFPTSIALTLFGAFYLSFTLNYIYRIKAERGPFYLYFLFSIIFLGDTGAYFIGKLLGKHKMTPMASPHKTWEGSLGGIVFGCFGGVLAQQVLVPKEVGIGQALLCGLLVHAVAQLSDPLESLFKRAVGVKDSANILPGHGGFLDRIDSLILASPFFYYFIKFFWK